VVIHLKERITVFAPKKNIRAEKQVRMCVRGEFLNLSREFATKRKIYCERECKKRKPSRNQLGNGEN